MTVGRWTWHRSELVIARGSAPAQQQTLRANFARVESREWWLWAAAFAVTLLLTVAVASVLLPSSTSLQTDFFAREIRPQAIRGLVALVLLFDLYTFYQHLLIHRIRKQILEREELFHLISENAADMIAVVDMNGKRLFNSRSYEKVLGYTTEELQASSAFEQIHPDDQERVKTVTGKARRSGTGESLEYRFRHKNGSWLVLQSTSSVIRDEKGEPEKLVIVNRDITEHRKADEALRRSEADFRSVVEHAPYGIYRVSADGALAQANPALLKMLVYETESELLRKELPTEIFAKAEEYREFADLLAKNAEIKDLEMQWKKKDGEPITLRCTGRRVGSQDGAPGYFEIFAEDVTEQRLLERQLRMAQKMEAIGRLSGGVAHDFNNLLGVIIGYSRVLSKALGKENRLSEHVREIEKAGDRAASLTKQLLAFSRQQILTPTVLHLNTLVCDMQKMLPRLLGEDIHMVQELDPELGYVKADQSQIEQVIMNLAVNARDAMPNGGVLRIQTSNAELNQAYTRTHPGSREGRYVLLTVSDTGNGIEAATLPHIFEPFFTTKERGKGTGLGLATVYGVVKQSNGYIWVDSSPGKGSCFQIYLPRLAEECPVEEEKNKVRESLGGSERVLLVEDAEPLRALAQGFLADAGYRVRSARNAEEALSLVESLAETFDLLLTDVVMPGMNGRALAEKLISRQPGLKVLYMSGYTDSVIAAQGVLDPGTQFLQKPFTEEILRRKVREVLDGGKNGSDQLDHVALSENRPID
jgi:two-component system, cell cycle sensor histidine kinase and response regulator CckA